ncbi:MAG: prepilin peptidase [Shimia sp.]
MDLTLPPLAAALWLGPWLIAWAWMSWTDLRGMRIPNALSLSLVALFVLTAPWVFPLLALALHVALAGVVLALGIALNHWDKLGGGDAKVLATAALFIAPRDGFIALGLLCLSALVWVALLTATGKRPMDRRIPLGPALGAVPVFYLALALYPARAIGL